MQGREILIVEDDIAIREMVDLALSRTGFEVRTAANAVLAEREIERSPPSLILLDWMLPGISGIELAHRLRRDKTARDIPIIMLTAKGEEGDRLRGFDAGVDDFIVKPFSIKELVARIRAVLKRTAPKNDQEPLEIDGLRLDPISHRLTYQGETIRIGPTEFRILRLFMGHPDRAFTRRQILDRIWGGDVSIEERTVDVHIRRLRKALRGHGGRGFERYVQTVHGTGYRFSHRKD
ncbi:phosphate regulon transcriptional regulator PhoB [Thioalkalivibrio sp. HK1]|uniref:phosphate regulon transcriptional regulator PhoB n=1 Tax=Thioalkalivibrio sp. HK1 TaxID=1469245 RepID=UPI0004719DD1|nr:phosphate regulon transcriptional regulator PhoB [Thioalkalivibrio sp. HK1]